MLIIIPLIIVFVITHVYCYKPKFSSSKRISSSRQVRNASYLILTQPVWQRLSLCSSRECIHRSCLRFPPLWIWMGYLCGRFPVCLRCSSRIKAVFYFLEGEIQGLPKKHPFSLVKSYLKPFLCLPQPLCCHQRYLEVSVVRSRQLQLLFTGKTSRPNKKYVRDGSYCLVLPRLKILKWYQWS